MRLSFDRLAGALASLAPVYLVYGDEPLQLIEAVDLIRQACWRNGFKERRVYSVLPGFDWNLLAADIETAGSLFASRRLLEVRLPEGKVSSEGTRVLTRYAESPPEDTVLLLQLENFPTASKSDWFLLLEKLGVAVQTHSLSGQEFQAYLARRAKSKGLELEREALELLAARTEGNLLAAVQEIDKLYVLYGAARIDAKSLAEAVAESARFEVFDLSEAWLAGKAQRVDRILAGLRAEGIAPAVILWSIAREVRLLLQLTENQRGGVPPTESFKRLRLWERRKQLLERALNRLSRSALHKALLALGRIDALIKGQAVGDVWAALRALCLALANSELFELVD
jgi:DNA polymerase-3 subunit delta